MISDNACAASITMGASLVQCLVLPFWLLLLVTTVAMPLTTRMTGILKKARITNMTWLSPGSETVAILSVVLRIWQRKLPQSERRLQQLLHEDARAPTDISKLRRNARPLRDPGPTSA